jgi:hypothetical protein
VLVLENTLEQWEFKRILAIGGNRPRIRPNPIYSPTRPSFGKRMTFEDNVREYINKTHANAWRLTTGAKPDEPAFVSSFLSKSMYRGLRDVIRTHAGQGTDVMARGIFTHQTPKVQLLTQTQAVEIADLMLVHQHFTKNRRKPTFGRAMLFQAKKTSLPTTGSVASGTQAFQFELYRDWSPFVGIVRLKSAPNGYSSWDFRTGGTVPQVVAASSAEYLTIFDQKAFAIGVANPQWRATLRKGPAHPILANSYPAMCTWSAGATPAPGALAANGVSCPVDFGRIFIDLLRGMRGRQFSPGVFVGPDHWSIFVNTMLSISARPNGDYVYTSRNQDVMAGMRGRNLAYLQTLPALWHAIEEEIDCFLIGGHDVQPNGFAVINGLLNHFSEATEGYNEVPPPESPERWESPISGHVPILLITTIGNEVPQFNVEIG